MSKTIFMGDGKLSEEERADLPAIQKDQEERLKDLHELELQKEKSKKMVTLEQLLATRIDPTEDRVVVFPDPVETVTESGIIKPQEVIEKERPLTGTVIAVGPGKKVEEKVTHILLVHLLQYGSDMPAGELQALQKEIFDIGMPYKPGERVLYGRMAGTPVEDPETKTPLLIMRPMDIFAKI